MLIFSFNNSSCVYYSIFLGRNGKRNELGLFYVVLCFVEEDVDIMDWKRVVIYFELLFIYY